MVDYGFGVQLGPISCIDQETTWHWRNMPQIYKWCRQYEPIDTWTHEKWRKSLADRQDVKMYGIFAETLSPRGVCGLTSLDFINRKAEFSLYIGPEHQGIGLGQAALKTLCAHAFMALGLNHIFGETFDGNPAAQSFESVGFIKEGTRRGFYYRDGKFIDAHLYSILNQEFRLKWAL